MVINLTDPLFVPIATGIVIALVLGTYHYVKTLVELNLTNKKLSNILSEMDSVHKDYKDQISKIKKIDDEKIKTLFETYDSKIINLIQHYQSLPPHGGVNWLREWYLYGKKSKSKKNS